MRASSINSGESRGLAEVHHAQSNWSSVLELDRAPIACHSTIRDSKRGHAHHLANALEKPLLLPKDMKDLGKMSQ